MREGAVVSKQYTHGLVRVARWRSHLNDDNLLSRMGLRSGEPCIVVVHHK
jgi:hypothetical protein